MVRRVEDFLRRGEAFQYCHEDHIPSTLEWFKDGRIERSTQWKRPRWEPKMKGGRLVNRDKSWIWWPHMNTAYCCTLILLQKVYDFLCTSIRVLNFLVPYGYRLSKILMAGALTFLTWGQLTGDADPLE